MPVPAVGGAVRAGGGQVGPFRLDPAPGRVRVTGGRGARPGTARPSRRRSRPGSGRTGGSAPLSRSGPESCTAASSAAYARSRSCMPYRPAPPGWMRLARASRPSSRRASPAPVPVSAAAASTCTLPPGCRPSSRNTRAASAGRCWYDQEKTARTSARGSPPASSRSSRRWWSASSATSSASETSVRAAASSAAIRSASGSRAHAAARSAAAAGSRSTRAPISRRSSADRVRQGQQVEVEPLGAVHRHHAGQRVAAGDQHQARSGAGQQRPDLLDRGGVVQQHEHPPAGQLGPVPAGPLVELRRDLRPATPSAVRNQASASAAATGCSAS